MSARINTMTRDGRSTGAITVETLSDGAIGIGFVREGMTAQAIRLPRGIARLLADALEQELRDTGVKDRADG